MFPQQIRCVTCWVSMDQVACRPCDVHPCFTSSAYIMCQERGHQCLVSVVDKFKYIIVIVARDVSMHQAQENRL